jgi:hypothetical protein
MDNICGRDAKGASIKDREVVAYEEYIYEIGNGSFLDLSWSSGGGFSNVFPLPEYQKEALEYYYQHFEPNYTAQQSVCFSPYRAITDTYC